MLQKYLSEVHRALMLTVIMFAPSWITLSENASYLLKNSRKKNGIANEIVKAKNHCCFPQFLGSLPPSLKINSMDRPTSSELILHSLFSNRAVLQRNQPIHVWGRGPEWGLVSVQLGGHEGSSKVVNGNWSVTLPPLPAGGPFVLTVRCGEVQRVVKNILIGEVFLCSGQSNMQINVAALATSAELIPKAENPNLRLLLHYSPPTVRAAEDCANARWAACTPENAPEQPALPLLFGLSLQQKLGIPVGLLCVAEGGTGILSWMPPSSFESHDDLRDYWSAYPWVQDAYDAIYARWQADRRAYDEENARRLAAQDELLPMTKYLFFGPRGPKCSAQPAGFYHSRIHPLAPFAISAVLWYQGETDAEVPEHYARNLRELVNGWRALWKAPQLPFFIVELVKFSGEDVTRNWPFIREAQTKVTDELDDLILIPGVDLGDPKDIHPSDKALVAERLARFTALAATNGSLPESPRIVKADIDKDGTAMVTFSKPVRATRSAICGFEFAGTDGVFHEATAQLLTPRTALIKPASFEHAPQALRYLWHGAPDPCLFSEDGLPVMPFRTDTARHPFHTEDHYCSAWANGI